MKPLLLLLLIVPTAYGLTIGASPSRMSVVLEPGEEITKEVVLSKDTGAIVYLTAGCSDMVECPDIMMLNRREPYRFRISAPRKEGEYDMHINLSLSLDRGQKRIILPLTIDAKVTEEKVKDIHLIDARAMRFSTGVMLFLYLSNEGNMEDTIHIRHSSGSHDGKIAVTIPAHTRVRRAFHLLDATDRIRIWHGEDVREPFVREAIWKDLLL